MTSNNCDKYFCFQEVNIHILFYILDLHIIKIIPNNK